MITVHILPQEETRTFERAGTALRLLELLGILPTDALVIRGRELLTPDRRIHSGDEITVRRVTSTG